MPLQDGSHARLHERPNNDISILESYAQFLVHEAELCDLDVLLWDWGGGALPRLSIDHDDVLPTCRNEVRTPFNQLTPITTHCSISTIEHIPQIRLDHNLINYFIKLWLVYSFDMHLLKTTNGTIDIFVSPVEVSLVKAIWIPTLGVR